MRGIILTKTGNWYICDEKPDSSKDGKFVVGELATGGEVSVPIDNIEAVEWYGDWTETFRTRYDQLKGARQ